MPQTYNMDDINMRSACLLGHHNTVETLYKWHCVVTYETILETINIDHHEVIRVILEHGRPKWANTSETFGRILLKHAVGSRSLKSAAVIMAWMWNEGDISCIGRNKAYPVLLDQMLYCVRHDMADFVSICALYISPANSMIMDTAIEHQSLAVIRRLHDSFTGHNYVKMLSVAYQHNNAKMTDLVIELAGTAIF